MTLRRPPIVKLDNVIQLGSTQIVVANLVPYPDVTGVGVTAAITFQVLDLGPGADQPSLVLVDIDGQPAYDGAGFQAPWNIGSSLVKSASPGSGVNDIWSFSIAHVPYPWSSEQVVVVRVQATSSGGHAIDFEYEFTVADVVTPTVLDVVGAEPRRVFVEFSEAMDASTVVPACFQLILDEVPAWAPSTGLPMSVTALTTSLYVLEFEQELSNAKGYVLQVQGCEDMVGNAVALTDMPFTSAAYPAPADRKWDLWRWVPARVRRADSILTGSSPGDTQKFVAIFQEIVDLWLLDVDVDEFLYDISRAPEGAIDLLLHFLYNPFRFVLTETQKRKLLAMLPTVNASKHEQGLVDIIFFFLGITVTIEKLNAGGWRLGSDLLTPAEMAVRGYGKLGEAGATASGAARLLGSPGERWPYTFIVHCPVYLTDDERTKMIQIIEAMKNSHEHYTIDEPAAPPLPIWHLGYDALGIGTRLGE